MTNDVCPDVNRRTLLRTLSATGALAVAGCLSEGPGSQPADTDTTTDDSATTDEPVATPTETPGATTTDPGAGTGTPTDSPMDVHTDTMSETPDSDSSATPSGVASQSLRVIQSGCGSQNEEASVSFDDGATVTVTGTIWGTDSCATAVLSAVRLDGGSLTVVVGTESDADPGTACAECITQIEYEATVEFDSALPEDVTVVHDYGDEQSEITTATR